MTISDINSRIQLQLPNVVLSPALFDNDVTLTPVLQQFFSRQLGSISISNVQTANYSFDAVKGTVTFSGTGQGGAFDGFSISQAVIRFVNGSPQIAITGSRTDAWTLNTGFPELASPVLKLLPVNAPQLCWGSYDSEADETILGFYLEGSLDLDAAPLNLLKFLLPGLEAPIVWGTIGMEGTNTGTVIQYVPSMVLTIDASEESATVGPFTMYGPQLKIFSAPQFNVNDKEWQANSFVRILNAIAFNEDNYISLEADIKDLSSIVLNAKMDLPIGGAISELEQLLGVSGLLTIPGFELQSPGDINLKDITIGMSLNGTPAINMISVDIGTSADEKWKLWGDNTLENIDVTFEVIPGSGGTPTQISGSFAGTVDEWLVLKAGFSNDSYSFYGGIAQPVKIKDAYAFFTGSANDDLPDIEVDTLDVSFTMPPADTGSYEYGGGISLDGDWQLFTQPFVFALKGLMFRINHTRDGKNAFTSNAVLDIGDYSLVIEGDYATDDGWTLSGDLNLLNEGQNLTQISDRIDGEFHVDTSSPKLPGFIADWLVQAMSATYNTKRNDFDFTVDIRNSSIPGLDMNFGIHLKHSDTSVRKEFDATATYAATNVNVEFDIAISEETVTSPAPSTTVTFNGAYKANVPPKLSDLLLALSEDLGVDVTIPQELQMDLEANDFAVLVQQKDADPVEMEIVGDISWQIEGTNLAVNLVYSNKTAFDQGFTQPALVDGKPAYVLGVALGGIINLEALPFVGKLPGIDKLAIDKLGFYYTNATVNAGQQLYFQIPQISSPGKLSAPTPASLAKSGFNLTATFGTINNSTTPASVSPMGTMPIPVSTGTAAAKPSFATAAAKSSSPVSWIDINKTFGPLSLKQVGLNYSNGEATVGLSAALALGSFSLDVQGLSVTFPMALPGQSTAGDISFDLEGLGMDIKEPGFELGGYFMKVKDPVTKSLNFYGEVIAQVGTFGLKAIGGYSPDASPPSFFIYAKVDVPLGGPPFLFVTGFAGGFGINNSLNLPTIDELPYCPLLPNNAPAQGASASDAMQRVLPILESMFTPKAGEYWVAAGIQFTSFEMVNAFVLVTVAFGVDLRIGVIGTASMTFPTGSPEPVAYIEIDIMASYTQSSGLLAVDGRLSPASYIYGGFVKLSGGFAFYTWLSGPHQGDFVVSVGGYHPAFTKPAHYPTVPRLSISYGLGPFQVVGQAYFALTPGMMMAGMQMQATWHSGSIKAWMNAGIDFLIAWAPFHYEADAYISIGVSANVGLFTINVSVGADLYIWGPEFGGKAHVDLDVVSFTIEFGASKTLPPPVGWDTFKSNFLPQGNKSNSNKMAAFALAAAAPPPTSSTNIIGASVSEGLLQKDVAGYNWVLDPDHFNIVTNSTIPANYASLNPTSDNESNIPNDKTQYDAAIINAPYLALDGMPIFDQNGHVWNPDLHIGPMGADNVSSYHYISIGKKNDEGKYDLVNTFRLIPVLLNSTAALWSQQKDEKHPDDASQVTFTLTGFSIQPIPRNPWQVRDVPLVSLLFQQGYNRDFRYSQQLADTRYTVDASLDDKEDLSITVAGAAMPDLPVNTNYVLNSINNSWVQQQRNAILDDLAQNDFYTFGSSEINLDDFAKSAQLTDWPVVELLGADPVFQY